MRAAKSKFVFLLLAAMIVVYLAFQVYNVMSPAYRTEIAVLYTVTDRIEAEGTVVRSEQAAQKQSGISYYLVSDGDKVAKGAVVAERYASAQQAADSLRLQQLQQELEVVQSLGDGSRGSVNLASLRRSIYAAGAELCASTAAGDYSVGAQLHTELLSLLGSYALSSGSELDTAARTEELKAEVSALSSRELDASAFVYSEASGYFVSFTDGCERIISPEELQTLPAEELAAAIETAHSSYAPDDNEYKILSGYTWYYLCSMTPEQAQRLKEGRSYTLNFRYSTAGDIPAVAQRIVLDEAGEKAVVVFSCDRLNPEIARLRNEDVTVRFTNYKGIRVQRSSLRMVDGKLGVYIKYGSAVKFRLVDIIYETEDYVVSSVTEGNGEYLALYDEIIVSGKQLYVDKELA